VRHFHRICVIYASRDNSVRVLDVGIARGDVRTMSGIPHENVRIPGYRMGVICVVIAVFRENFLPDCVLVSFREMSGYVRIPGYRMGVICVVIAVFRENFLPDYVVVSFRKMSGNVRKEFCPQCVRYSCLNRTLIPGTCGNPMQNYQDFGTDTIIFLSAVVRYFVRNERNTGLRV